MKKFLSELLIFCVTCISCEATQIVPYNITGQPVMHGRTHFGSNALFTPQNRMRAGARSRAIAREKAITRALYSMGRRGYTCPRNYMPVRTSVSTPVVSQSRFNKNYVIRTQKSYTKNGITYYN